VTVAHPVHVVVAYDFSLSSELALARAIDVAARAPQHVLHVVAALDPHTHPLRGVPYERADELQQQISERIAAAFAKRETAAEVRFYVHARIGTPASQILALAKEIGADLIFIGSHGKTGVERFLLGSVSERVVREARCPVLVARAKTYGDVDLLNVLPYEHEHKPHREPHCYTYTNKAIMLRPTDWPLL
jgi:nucleotide-binding universal stress UspA family protein